MGVELEEQNLKIEAMQQRTEEAGEGLKTVAKSAGKLVGREPRAARCSAGAEQDAAAAAVANAAVKAAPMAVRYGVR